MRSTPSGLQVTFVIYACSDAHHLCSKSPLNFHCAEEDMDLSDPQSWLFGIVVVVLIHRRLNPAAPSLMATESLVLGSGRFCYLEILLCFIIWRRTTSLPSTEETMSLSVPETWTNLTLEHGSCRCFSVVQGQGLSVLFSDLNRRKPWRP